ncbi:conserved hypothetical protein [Uncinocarpus reesii 1704]|uniref:Histone chaperone domain-containing protein n=1 Tax=Uncinocarpus reesii (strain UAMH 1704) TaxID=336963 RepID=C4JW72_UNCRE|nr:uncharacterized protein UREG_06814 [Uncinocarpus reesii 1704]EEP81949.1 conserved hypothetical protein [Uncinocarpus reesii 1704]
MSSRAEREAEDLYEAQNDPSPVEGNAGDDSYAQMGTGRNEPIAVQSDSAKVEDPMKPFSANTDAQLAQDEREAIDKSNIMKGSRTRRAKPQGQGYSEGPDEDDLPDQPMT